jgi:hypothetical protein
MGPLTHVMAAGGCWQRESGGVADGTRTHDNRNHKPAAHQSALAAPTAPGGDEEESDAAEEVDEDELPDTAAANVIAPSASIPVTANAGLGNLFDS